MCHFTTVCVPANECSSVGNCSQCHGALQTCVEEVTQLGTIRHCVDLPDSCQGTGTCACMGASVCIGAFDTCDDSMTGPVCSCPAC